MTFTFTQADVEKLIEDHLAKKNYKVVGKYHPNKQNNTVSVDVEEITTGAKAPDFKQLFQHLKEAKTNVTTRYHELCDQCKSELSGQPQKGICTCSPRNKSSANDCTME